MKFFKKLDISQTSLILANLVTLISCLIFKWDLFSVLFLYWIESGIIGFYMILKMIILPNVFPNSTDYNVTILGIEQKSFGKTSTILIKIFLIPFFCFHYGGFMIGHLVFILVIPNILNQSASYQLILSGIIPLILISIISLFISHGISFYTNFVKKREYERASIHQLTISPYKRIIVMHITLIAGSFIIAFTKMPVFTMAFFIIIKTIVDLNAHNKEHSTIRTRRQ